MNVPAVARRLWTREEYERMIERGIFRPDDRLELIAGEIVVMSPQKGPHATAVGLGQDILTEVVGRDFHVRVQLPLALDLDSEPEPDLAVVRGPRRDYRVAHPTTAALVVEVADATLAYDRETKGSLYARACLPDYWIVNLVDRVLEVYRQPAPDTAALLGYTYRERLRFGPQDRVSLLSTPEASVLVADLLP